MNILIFNAADLTWKGPVTTQCALPHAFSFLTNVSVAVEKLRTTTVLSGGGTECGILGRRLSPTLESQLLQRTCNTAIWNGASVPLPLKDHGSSLRLLTAYTGCLIHGQTACTADTRLDITVLSKFKGNCHRMDLMYFIHTGKCRNSHLLYGLNVWFVLHTWYMFPFIASLHNEQIRTTANTQFINKLLLQEAVTSRIHQQSQYSESSSPKMSLSDFSNNLTGSL